MRHTISILLQNEAGALTRVAGLFSSRGYNIESLHVAPTQEDSVSRLTLVTSGSESVIDQICSQLLKLVDVVDLLDMTAVGHIERELLLVKLQLGDAPTPPMRKLLDDAGARVLDDRPASYTLELTASGPAIDAFLEQLEKFAEVTSVVRSGSMAVSRGAPAYG